MDTSHSRHYFFLGLLIAILALNAIVFYPFLGTLIFAGTFAALFGPWHKKIFGLMPKLPAMASFLTILLIFVLIITPLVFMGILVFNQAQDFYFSLVAGAPQGATFAGTFSYLAEQVPSLSYLLPFIDSLDVYAQQAAGYIAKNLGAVFSGVASAALNIFITLVALFFFFKDGSHFRTALLRFSPLEDGDDAMILAHLDRVVNSVIKGSLFVALIQGILAGIGYLVFGIPSPALWGATTTLTALIPGIGTAAIFLPAIIYLYAIGKTSAAIGLLIWGFVIVGGVDNILKPKLIGSSAGIHPFLILLSVLGGLIIFGIYGFLLGPLLLGLLFALIDMHKKGVAAHQHPVQ